jgi:hypothetical protein
VDVDFVEKGVQGRRMGQDSLAILGPGHVLFFERGQLFQRVAAHVAVELVGIHQTPPD